MAALVPDMSGHVQHNNHTARHKGKARKSSRPKHWAPKHNFVRFRSHEVSSKVSFSCSFLGHFQFFQVLLVIIISSH